MVCSSHVVKTKVSADKNYGRPLSHTPGTPSAATQPPFVRYDVINSLITITITRRLLDHELRQSPQVRRGELGRSQLQVGGQPSRAGSARIHPDTGTSTTTGKFMGPTFFFIHGTLLIYVGTPEWLNRSKEQQIVVISGSRQPGWKSLI